MNQQKGEELKFPKNGRFFPGSAQISHGTVGRPAERTEPEIHMSGHTAKPEIKKEQLGRYITL